MFPTRRIITSGGDVYRDQFSLEFDGTDDYLTKAVSNYRASDSSGSISAWVQCPSSLTTGTIFSTSDTGGDEYFLHFGLYQSKLNMWEKNGDGDPESQVQSTATINDGKWHHCVLTADGSATNYKLYIDGALAALAIATENDGNWLNVTGDEERDNITIGALTRQSGTVNFWNGIINEVSIWNKVLSAGDISALYQAKGTANLNDDGNSGNLVGWWRMGDGLENSSGTTIYDMSDNTNNGTLTNHTGLYSGDVPR